MAMPPVGTVLQQGVGFKEIVIGPNWQWINTYINLSIDAVVSAEPNRPYEVASGLVLPWNDVGPNKRQGRGPIILSLGPFGQLYARSLDGSATVFGYHDKAVSVAWKGIPIEF
jgi:hypothetical protein